jgi:ribosome-associated protein
VTTFVSEDIKVCVQSALSDKKGIDICWLDVRSLTSLADFMVIVTGTSSRHVKALAKGVEADCLEHSQLKPLGVEGGQGANWMLVDMNGVLVHIMTKEARALYQLESLWDPVWKND